MPHRRLPQSRTSPTTQSRKTGRRPGWLRRLLSRATDAGLSSATYDLEVLEKRVLLTTVDSIGAAGNIVFYTGQGQIGVMSYSDVDFTAQFAYVNTSTGMATLGDYAPAGNPEPTLGANLYQLTITESNADSYMSIYTFSALPGTAPTPVPTPFAGTIPTFTIVNTLGVQATATMPGNTGGILIGAVNPVVPPGVPAPLPITAIGGVTPGITVDQVNPDTGAQNDFGNMLIGGTVTGSVYFGGNVNLFYAGGVLTGVMGGDALPTKATSTRVDPNNFYVAGDLRAFMTSGPVGTDGTGTPDDPNYITNFDLSVGGKLGEVKIGNSEQTGLGIGDFAGTIEVGNSPYVSQQLPYPNAAPAGAVNVIGLTTIQNEIETDIGKTNPNDPDFSWEDGDLDLRNDVQADAEFLDSIPIVDPNTNLPIENLDGQDEYYDSVDGDLGVPPGPPGADSFADQDDFYAAGLMAGETITVTVASGDDTATTSALTLQVFDPDGRLIATNVDSQVGPMQITPDRPGVYYFEISRGPAEANVDIDYNLTVKGIAQQAISGIDLGGFYNDVGEDAGIIAGTADLGAIVAGGPFASLTLGPTPTTTGTQITVTAPVHASTSILVANGNLNALVAASIGVDTVVAGNAGDIFGDGPTLDVPNGSVGLVQSTNPVTGSMDLETQFDPNYLEETTPQYVTDDAYASAIGGDIQHISCATVLYCLLAVNAGIGTIACGSMDSDPASYIDVNADNKGSDGIIDLIDVTGNLGSIGSGGPGIITHQGGQVRYMVVGGLMFRNIAFGSGEDTPVTYPAGQSITFTDDAGNIITATPEGPVETVQTTTVTTPANNSGSAVTTTTTTTIGPQITLSDYQTLDKGGDIPIAISSSGSMSITDSGGEGSVVTLGTLTIFGTGSAVVPTDALDQFGNPTVTQIPPVTNTSTGSTTTTASTTNADGSTSVVTTVTSGGGTTTALTLTLSGPEVIDVWDVVSTGPVGVPVSGEATLIENDTSGEIVNLSAPDVGTIFTHGNLGYATPVATDCALLPNTVIPFGNLYPFVQQHTGIVIGNITTFQGSAVNIDAYGGIGNIIVCSTLQSMIANYAVSTQIQGATPIPGQFDGIVGPVVGGALVATPIQVFGSILNIDVGQGVLPTGTGTVGFDGIYASGDLGLVDNAGNPSSMIRGNIVAEDDQFTSPATGGTTPGNAIGAIILHNASIVDAEVRIIYNWVPGGFVDTLGVTTAVAESNRVAFSNPDPFENHDASPFVYEIGSISVTGLGGILGSWINATDIGPIYVGAGGFGLLGGFVESEGQGEIAGLTVSGYGLRGTDIYDGAYVGPIVATGGGQTVSVLTYPIDVRESDNPQVTVDPYFGFTSVDDDLNDALGTSALQPNIASVTDTGVISDCEIQGQESFAGLTAQKVRTIEPLFSQGEVAPIPSVANIPVVGTAFPMEVSFGDSVGTIRVFQLIDGLQITTGHLGAFLPSGSVSRVGISVAGPINSLVIHGNFGQFITNPQTGLSEPDSYIDATGPSGIINSLIVYGDLNGNVTAQSRIGTVIIAHDLEGSITAQGQTTGLALNSLHVLGGIRDGSLTLDGSIGSIIVNGTLGTSAGSLTVNGNANLISVGALHSAPNSDLALALDVTGTLKTLLVHGQITGSVITGGNLNNLSVTADGAMPVLISGNITVSGRIGTARITGGSVASSIIATGSIGSFVIDGGSLLEPAVVESQIASISNFTILGGLAYGLYGSVLAQSGRNDKINVSGNMGDGINPATVTALSGATFLIRGSIADNASIQVSDQLNLLQVDGNIETGAVVAAHPLRKLKVIGSNTGTITAV